MLALSFRLLEYRISKNLSNLEPEVFDFVIVLIMFEVRLPAQEVNMNPLLACALHFRSSMLNLM